MTDYEPPAHNLSIFNAEEFQLIVPSTNVAGLVQINQQVGLNNAQLEENTVLIDSYRQFFQTTVPTATTYSQSVTYTYALPPLGQAPPTNVPFKVYVFFNLASNGGSLTQLTCSLVNNGVPSQTQQWNQGGANTTGNIQQTLLTTQFTFNALGNGLPWTISFNVNGIGTYVENPNTMFGGLVTLNNIQVLWL